MIKYLFLLLLGVFIALVGVYGSIPQYIQSGNASVCKTSIKRAMRKMGPYYNYRILSNGTLQVELRGKWLRLRY